MASPQSQVSPQQQSFGGMNDAFSSLSFGQAAPQAPKPTPFSGLDSLSSAKSPPTTSSSNMFGGGGNFFDSPKSPPAYGQAQNRTMSPASGMSDFSSFSTPAASKPAGSSSGMGDLLDLSMPSAPAPAPAHVSSPPHNSAFNLSTPAPAPAPAPQAQANPAPVSYSGFSNMDAWGSNDVWGSSAPAPSQPAAPTTTSSHVRPKSPGWGAPQVAQVAQDDDFGGWSSAAPTQQMQQSSAPPQQQQTQSKPFGGNDDLFSNVWE
jgi:stromal membrane-associated protein